MTTAHVYFADVPLSSPSPTSSATSVTAPEGHRSTFESVNNDAMMQRQCISKHTAAIDRSSSPNSNATMPSTPRYERNMGFFRQLSRRFGLRSNDDLVYSGSNEEDNQSSSTDSCSSHRGENANSNREGHPPCHPNASNIMTASMMTMSITEHISCASSETSSTVDIDEQQQQQQQQKEQQQVANDGEKDTEGSQNASGEAYNKDRKSFGRSSFSRLSRRSSTSIRRAFGAFSLTSRSLSCSGSTPPHPPTALVTNQHLHTSSVAKNGSGCGGGTPIKSALKSSSNLELNKKSSLASSSSSSPSTSATKASTSTGPACCSASKTSKTKTKPPPQRILRQPVSYTYLKGISGLPTQRVPRNSVCCQYARR
ncbi:uncharacterized protein LOC142235914 [Haematobia irritans]|uniref:uncharacterized protein LOC142235914 n=1 Tax=Haematobia irritans TaxID=7368 RepID=UPI003F4FC29F